MLPCSEKLHDNTATVMKAAATCRNWVNESMRGESAFHFNWRRSSKHEPTIPVRCCQPVSNGRRFRARKRSKHPRSHPTMSPFRVASGPQSLETYPAPTNRSGDSAAAALLLQAMCITQGTPEIRYLSHGLWTAT